VCRNVKVARSVQGKGAWRGASWIRPSEGVCSPPPPSSSASSVRPHGRHNAMSAGTARSTRRDGMPSPCVGRSVRPSRIVAYLAGRWLGSPPDRYQVSGGGAAPGARHALAPPGQTATDRRTDERTDDASWRHCFPGACTSVKTVSGPSVDQLSLNIAARRRRRRRRRPRAVRGIYLCTLHAPGGGAAGRERTTDHRVNDAYPAFDMSPRRFVGGGGRSTSRNEGGRASHQTTSRYVNYFCKTSHQLKV